MVVVTTGRGPWKLCPNFTCPSKEEAKDEKKAKASKGKRRTRRKK
jgi:DNA topoisomerase-1